MKIRPLGAEMLRSDGRTGMRKLVVAVRNFVNAPKKLLIMTSLFM
jgi:hypothetical protein